MLYVLGRASWIMFRIIHQIDSRPWIICIQIMTFTKLCFFQSSELSADTGEETGGAQRSFSPISFDPLAVLILGAGQENLSPGNVPHWKGGFSKLGKQQGLVPKPGLWRLIHAGSGRCWSCVHFCLTVAGCWEMRPGSLSRWCRSTCIYSLKQLAAYPSTNLMGETLMKQLCPDGISHCVSWTHFAHLSALERRG